MAGAAAAGAGSSSPAGFSLLLQATMAVAVAIIINELISGLRRIARLRVCGSGIIANNRQQSIEPLYESPWIGKLGSFSQHRLFEDHQRELIEFGGVFEIFQILHQVMFDIELGHRLAGRSLLSGQRSDR